MELTSGYPFGSRKASGISQSGGRPCLSLGGEGYAEYSVIARELSLGVRGEPLPFVKGVSAMLYNMGDTSVIASQQLSKCGPLNLRYATFDELIGTLIFFWQPELGLTELT